MKLVVTLLLLFIHLSLAWDTLFKYIPCYNQKLEDRMPLSIDNFVAILENYEREKSNMAPEDVANALLFRYRKNGVAFDPGSKTQNWALLQVDETYKQNLDDKLLKIFREVPEDAFMPREECSIHMMISHSLDLYPHAGVDYIWDNNNDYYSSNSRKQRSVKYSERGIYVPDGVEYAEHPLEFGVIQTNAGPIAGGLLLAGIAAMSTTSSPKVSDLITSNNEIIPQEILNLRVDPLLGGTISGELAQAAILNAMKSDNFEVGPTGLFGNCSCCPKLYSLKDNVISNLSRAEIFGALDGLIIAKALNSRSSSQSLQLSQVFRMYYSDHGLFSQDIRACNRKSLFTRYLDSIKADIEDEALNYMFALQPMYPALQNTYTENQGDVEAIKEDFMSALSPVISEFQSFMSSYSYDDPGYEECPRLAQDEAQPDTEADLVVVYTPTGDIRDILKQIDYIGLTARAIEVGYHRSRIAILNGRLLEWISPMTNYSNIADYICNYTARRDYSGTSSQNYVDVLDELTKFYSAIYSYIREDPDRTGKNSQVVLWNLPTSFDGDEQEANDAWEVFNRTFPDVTFMYAGLKSDILKPIYNSDNKNEDALIFVSTSNREAKEISDEIVEYIERAPRMFVYPACDTTQSQYDNYNEDSHVYRVYVSPNFTTYIRIPAQNFFFSENVKLTFSKGSVRVCVSRINTEPSDGDKEEDTECGDPSFEVEVGHPCDRYLEDCAPIYISVKGNPNSISYCSDEACLLPNQIEFEMRHDGMVCSADALIPGALILLAAFVSVCNKYRIN